MLALKGEHHGSHLAGLWRNPKSMEVRSKSNSAIHHAGELAHPALSSRLVTLNKGILFCCNNAGMLLKTKERCGKSLGEAGML
jgi:hypothetical protein